ncbi:MAG: hypothetical protein ACRDO1_21315, partial [Nocardioidaceae bacterium]
SVCAARGPLMFVIAISLLVVLGLAALVAVFVAFPHQGKEIPRAEWLTGAMHRGSDRVVQYLEGPLDSRQPTGRD